VALAKAVFKSGRDLVSAFLVEPLPKELFLLSRYGKVEPPWAPPSPGAGPEEYAAAWATGYDGGPIRGAFRWLGMQGSQTAMTFLPKSFQKRGRPPKSPPISDFSAIPEAERMIKYLLRSGAAIHDIHEMMLGFREVWVELDKIRPDTWSLEDMVDLLDERTQRLKDTDVVPPAMVFLWSSSNHPYHARQVERAQRVLLQGLRAVLPGSHRASRI
jgi:hypothetical protein